MFNWIFSRVFACGYGLCRKKKMTDQEINEAVARKLGYCTTKYRKNGCLRPYYIQHEKDYCHSIEAAWEIMEEHDIALFKTKQGHWCSYTNFGLSEEDTEEWYFRAESRDWHDGGISVADTA